MLGDAELTWGKGACPFNSLFCTLERVRILSVRLAWARSVVLAFNSFSAPLARLLGKEISRKEKVKFGIARKKGDSPLLENHKRAEMR